MDSRNVTIRLLTGEPPQVQELQRVLEEAPTYAQRVTGLPVGPADAQSTFIGLPDGKTYDDKFVFGIFLGDEMVGCIDLIRAYPIPTTSHIGLLLISEKHHGQGIGRQAYALVEQFIREWGTCDTVRLGVVRTNEEVVSFWKKMGFEPTGGVKPFQYASVVSETIVFQKPLAKKAS